MPENFESKALETTEQKNSPEQQQAHNDIIDAVKQDTQNIENDAKKQAIYKLAETSLQKMSEEWVNLKDIRDSKINWQNLLSNFLLKQPNKDISLYNKILSNPQHKHYFRTIWVIKNNLEIRNFKADISKDLENQNKLNEKKRKENEGKIKEGEELDNKIKELEAEVKKQKRE